MTRALALGLTLLTGFSGLVYEITWQKYLATLLGSHSEATAAVLGLYLGGLAAGYALFGWVTRRTVERARQRGGPPRLLFVYGLAEIGIGLFAFAFPFLFGVVQRISVWVPTGHETVSFGFDVGLSALLIVPPTILMGGTIPLLTQALSRGLSDATRIHAFVYAFNTAGAFAGALAAGFVLIHWLGLDGVLRVMGAINLSAGAVFLALGFLRGAGPRGDEAPDAAAPSLVPRSFAALAWVAGLAGFSMMALQTTLNRVAGLALGSSHFTFAMVVAVFVLCIALGSFVVSALSRIPPWLVAGSQWLLVALLVLLYLGIPDAGYGAHVLRSFFRDDPEAFFPFQFTIFVAGLAILFVPIGLSGALLPLLFHHLRNEVGDLGRVAGSLYSWNTVGSLAGALIGGYVLLIWLDLDTVYAVALGALAVGAGILTTRVAGARTAVAAGMTAVALAGIALLPPWDPNHLAIGRFRTRTPTPVTYGGPTAFVEKHNQSTKLLFHDDDPVSTVVVLEAGDEPDVRSIMTNGKPDGSTGGDYPTMCLAGTIPALLTDDPTRSFVIGWGTGVTVGELAALPQTKEVVVAEISPGVLGAAPLFDPLNQGAISSPKSHPIRRDAYRALLRSEGRFGVIVSEPSNPWVTGVEMLFSREFLEAARSRLTPGGVYAQWFHLYEVDATTVDIVAATYASVFDRVAVWFASGPDVLLLGLNDPDGYPDLETIRARYEEPAMREGMARCGAKSFHQLLVHETLPPGLVSADRVSGAIHSLHHPILSQHAARAFFSGRGVELPRLPGGPDARDRDRPQALLARVLGPGPIPEETVATLARYVCEARRRPECAAWVGRWRADHPDSVAARRFDPRTLKRMAESEMVSPAMLARAESLFRGSPPSDTNSGNGLQRAVAVTNLFTKLYTHAIPFDRAVLRRTWSSCAQDGVPASTCQLARIRANEQLGRFELRRRPQGGF
jgi:predicted membrane-bound spermidine synthase